MKKGKRKQRKQRQEQLGPDDIRVHDEGLLVNGMTFDETGQAWAEAEVWCQIELADGRVYPFDGFVRIKADRRTT